VCGGGNKSSLYKKKKKRCVEGESYRTREHWAEMLELFPMLRSLLYLLLDHQGHVLQPFPSHQGALLSQVLLFLQDFLAPPSTTLECQKTAVLD
jgi:hypothetical protein